MAADSCLFHEGYFNIVAFIALFEFLSVALVLCGLFLTAKSCYGVRVSYQLFDHHWVVSVSLRLVVCSQCHVWKELTKHVLKGQKAFILD